MNRSIKSFIHLTSFEINRLFKFLTSIMIVTILANLIGFTLVPWQYTSDVNQYIVEENATLSQALEVFNTFTPSRVTHSFWVMGPVALGIIAFLFYSFFIWYREWFGRNTFAYRLLMLPVSRMQLFFSKLLTIFIGIFSLVSIKLISLYAGYHIALAIVPEEFTANVSFLHMLSEQFTFYYVLPIESSIFFPSIGLGLVFLIVLFTIILMERSFAVKGIVMGAAYGAGALLLTIFPFFLGDIFNNYYLLYNSELLIMVVIILLVISIVSIGISRHLLKHKITI